MIPLQAITPWIFHLSKTEEVGKVVNKDVSEERAFYIVQEQPKKGTMETTNSSML